MLGVLGCCGLKVDMAGTPASNSHREQSGGLQPFPGLSRSFENPPSKRARSFSETTVPEPEDPFGEHAEFTADDLEELDILASQALSQCPVVPRNLSSECLGWLSTGRWCRPLQPGSSSTGGLHQLCLLSFKNKIAPGLSVVLFQKAL